jgi:excisionase family DNA binding protein
VEKLLTPKQAADMAGVSVSLIYALCQEGRLTHLRLGRAGRRGCIRIAEGALADYLAACRSPCETTGGATTRHIR